MYKLHRVSFQGFLRTVKGRDNAVKCVMTGGNWEMANLFARTFVEK